MYTLSKADPRQTLLGHFVGRHGRIRTVEDLQRKLLDIGMCSHIIRYCIVFRILAFKLLSKPTSAVFCNP